MNSCSMLNTNQTHRQGSVYNRLIATVAGLSEPTMYGTDDHLREVPPSVGAHRQALSFRFFHVCYKSHSLEDYGLWYTVVALLF